LEFDEFDAVAVVASVVAMVIGCVETTIDATDVAAVALCAEMLKAPFVDVSITLATTRKMRKRRNFFIKKKVK
jgi:hypothetical protein